MANVGITQDLGFRVKETIKEMRVRETRAEVPDISKTYGIDASYAYHLGSWGAENLHLIQAIPEAWVQKVSDAAIELYDVEPDSPLSKLREVRCYINFTAMSASVMPTPTRSYVESRLSIQQVKALAEGTPGRLEMLQRWDDHLAYVALNKRWEKVQTEVMRFLNGCKSLNEAVKTFPEIRMYIAAADLRRLDAKALKPAPRSAALPADKDWLTAAAIAAKFAAAL